MEGPNAKYDPLYELPQGNLDLLGSDKKEKLPDVIENENISQISSDKRVPCYSDCDDSKDSKNKLLLQKLLYSLPPLND